MHHGKSNGKRNTRKVCKNTSILRNQREILQKRGEIGNLWRMTKKRSSETLADENRKSFGKSSDWGDFPQSLQNFSEIGGNLKQGDASLPQGDGRPCCVVCKKQVCRKHSQNIRSN